MNSFFGSNEFAKREATQYVINNVPKVDPAFPLLIHNQHNSRSDELQFDKAYRIGVI